ncbi:hypothetical protein SPBR_04160 [Sporothrix brasiliensis 5110]|uniref:LrgB-like protein n=1 Tax=Sporothrix brasiliensis 5110 TaxID=1398154 RepID=A0A0C2J9F7_9PEZI|nr:uncharacterized protein SPBR_04160 [Sporothrix brasiliensis 5110]KIH93592.1 hypothetical protein SPBR_04160 [Sporothrix brasiliensis 5110]
MASRPRKKRPVPVTASPATEDSNDMWPVAKDAAVAVKLVLVSDWRHFVRCFVYVPTGIFAILAACYGVDRLLALGGVSFPASVACLVLLFLSLLLADVLLGHHRTKALVQAINVPGGWSLRWLNLFFTPSFVMLPLSPPISATEVGKMVAVFVVGFLVMMVATAYMTRWIQLLTSPPRKSIDQQTEGARRDVLPGDGGIDDRRDDDEELAPLRTDFGGDRPSTDRTDGMPPLPPQSHAAAYITIRGQNLDDPLSSFSDVPAASSRMQMHLLRQSAAVLMARSSRRPQSAATSGTSSPTPPARADRWAAWLGKHADTLLCAGMGLFVGAPIYYATGYAMPLQLAVNVLMFFGAMSLPAAWRQILHPVLVSAFSTFLLIWLLGRVRGDGLVETLHQYRPGNTYLQVWSAATGSRKPGAGDVLASALDASIVSLALPMYQYRHELKHHFWAIVVPNILLSVASLFAYPVVCYRIGISAQRSLAFTSRSLTLALATPAVRNLGGDVNTVAAVAILSGVLGVLIGRKVLACLRIPEDDYVTRGVTFGANASALGTALLLRVDPRAAAISSLAMGLFGAITVAFSSVPPMVHIIRSLVGLE